MFHPADIVSAAFRRHVTDSFADLFPTAPLAHAEALSRAVRVGTTWVSRTDALYHDLEHLIQVVSVGQDILRGKMIRDGDVTSLDWLHYVGALCLFPVGFFRRLLPGDTDDSVVVCTSGRPEPLPEGATDGWLWRCFVDRSMMFVRGFFATDPVLDAERLAGIIDYARFPPPVDRQPDITGYPGLLRAAHLIGAVADPGFINKVTPLTLELSESGKLAELGFADAVEFRSRYPELFWGKLYPVIVEAVTLLELTGPGRDWLASMRSHLMREEHTAAFKAIAEPASLPT